MICLHDYYAALHNYNIDLAARNIAHNQNKDYVAACRHRKGFDKYANMARQCFDNMANKGWDSCAAVAIDALADIAESRAGAFAARDQAMLADK